VLFELIFAVHWTLVNVLQADFTLSTAVTFEDFMKYKSQHSFDIGGVPVMLEVHASLSLSIQPEPIKLRLIDEWTYKEPWKFGVKYRQNAQDQPGLENGGGFYEYTHVREGDAANSKHEQQALILDSDGVPSCPIKWDVNVILTPEFGVTFYDFLEVGMRVPFTLRTTVKFPLIEYRGDVQIVNPEGKNWCYGPIENWMYFVSCEISLDVYFHVLIKLPGVTPDKDTDNWTKWKRIMEDLQKHQNVNPKDVSLGWNIKPLETFILVAETVMFKDRFVPEEHELVIGGTPEMTPNPELGQKWLGMLKYQCCDLDHRKVVALSKCSLNCGTASKNANCGGCPVQ